MIKEHLLLKSNKIHEIDRYYNFVCLLHNRNDNNPAQNCETHRHHILPKAKDMYPEYKDFLTYSWNQLDCSLREHYIMHKMLAKIFPKSSQSRCYFYMSNTLGKKTSKHYELTKRDHIDNLKTIYTPERNKKISQALLGKPKSKEHISKLLGHPVSILTREKLRNANLGKKHNAEARLKMSKSRKGKTRAPHTENTKNIMSQTKKKAGLKWFTNGVKAILAKECPVGYTKGRRTRTDS